MRIHDPGPKPPSFFLCVGIAAGRVTTTEVCGVLSVVDLAGSERLKKSQSEGCI